MSQRRRPTAFDVSFPDETPSSSIALRESQPPHAPRPNANGSSSRSSRQSSVDLLGNALRYLPKRKDRDHPDSIASSKRRRTEQDRDPKLSYAPHPGDTQEKQDILILGEDPDDEGAKPDDVPVRILSDFCIFDPEDKYRIYSLEDQNVNNRSLEAAGYVAPVFVNEEDAGQEDDIEDDNPQRLRTTAIFRYTIDYEKTDDPLYIQTQFGWYQLRTPSSLYRRCFVDFYRPHRIAQIVISVAKENPRMSYQDFVDMYAETRDPLLGAKIHQTDIIATIPFISSVTHELNNVDELTSTALLRQLLTGDTPIVTPRSPSHPIHITGPREMVHARLTGNLDVAVLRPENQNPTHVTPIIDNLAVGLFQERLQVVGAKPPDRQNHRQAAVKTRAWLLELLWHWVDQDFGKKAVKTTFAGNARLENEYWKTVVIDGVPYSVGDVILAPAGSYKERSEQAPNFPTNPESIPAVATIADYFWFGQIVWINQKTKKLHCQWFEHASKTLMEEIGDPQELFLSNTCDTLDMRLVAGKATVQFNMSQSSANGPSEFYCSYIYDEEQACFADINEGYASAARDSSPPHNCPVCLLGEQQEHEEYSCIKNGFKLRGTNYHLNEYVLIRSESGPANVGQILVVPSAKKSRSLASDIVTVRMLGRISDILQICPNNVVKDERHLFFTDVESIIPVSSIDKRCLVIHSDSVPHLDEWLSLSPYHFHVRYHFPTKKPLKWREKRSLRFSEVICPPCFEEDTRHIDSMKRFQANLKRAPLRGFDPFGGVGAFGLGMETSGCVRMVHAVEISPSAAKTMQDNSPDTIVHNQCSNVVLQYAIKRHAGHNPEVPKEIGRPGYSLRDPPKPGDIDVVVAGFPCQPHSRLNMFQRANERKSHLILNLLSWIDFLRPKYCFLENVRGFLSYNLNATQAGRYRVEGGIQMGGVKFLVHALLVLGYQVRFGLLQAAHYGTPQSRVRFFLVAARQSYPLPQLPQPTHDFPLKDELALKFPNGGIATPIRTTNGVAPFSFVSIEDAIGDLPRFHWKNPRKLDRSASPRIRPRTGTTGSENDSDVNGDEDGRVPELACDRAQWYCGLKGPVEYHHRPRTTFQVKCRAKPTRDLQHYTRVLKEATVERVVNIPLNARADYKSLRRGLWEWQFSNPSSAMARDGFRPGLYGRLDKDQWFRTTVTNVEPTAKQSWVLNPYCKRVVSVRELARSQGFPDDFIFYSCNDDVKTMHRQIGNAVPWPVAVALGHELMEAAWQKWTMDVDEAIVIE